MSNRTIEAILRLSAKLGNMAAFRQLSGNLDRVDRKAKAFNRSQSVIAATTGKAMMATARFLAPAALAYGVKNSVTAYAAVERRLNRIAINADKGRDAVDSMLKVVNQTSYDYAMGQDDVTSGLETLVAAGRSADDALSFLPSVAATAQAAGAEVFDIATTADAVGNSFDITGDKMQHAFDILVKSGKQGKFELRDMARYLPSMSPAFAALGYKGEKGLSKLAAMLQTIRQRTGSAEEAATAAQNIFQKMESDQTVAKFKKFGIDLRGEMAKARKEGRDLVDVFLDLSQKAVKGDLSKIPQLFTDAQFQVGMRALMQGRGDMEGFQQALANVDGTTLRDLGQVLEDNQSKLDRMASSWDRFKTSLGRAASDPVGGLLDSVSDNLDYGEALRKTLEKRGMGYWERENWIFKNSFTDEGEKSKNLAAFEGGWRSPEGKLAEKGKMESSPELPHRRQAAENASPVAEDTKDDKRVTKKKQSSKRSRKNTFADLPQTMTVPAAGKDMVLPDLRYNRFPAPTPAHMRQILDEETTRRRKQLAADTGSDIKADMVSGGGDGSRSAVASAISDFVASLQKAAMRPIPRTEFVEPTTQPLSADTSAPPRNMDAIADRRAGPITPDRSRESENASKVAFRADRPTFKESENASMAALRADPSGIDNAIQQALASGGDDISRSLRDGGEQAGRSISEAAAAINRASEQGGSTFARMLQGLGSKIGQEAAAAFNASVKPIPVSEPRKQLMQATGNMGRSMPAAGGAQ